MAGIITILAALIPFAIWIIKIRYATKTDPKNELSAARNENAKTVALGTDADVNALLERRIDRVRPSNVNPVG